MLEHVVFEWRDALDILLVAFLLYQVIQLLRGSRALTVLTGLGLLTLLYLGIKNIRLGPTLPAFVSPNVLQYLVENFGIAPITTPEEDLKQLLQ